MAFRSDDRDFRWPPCGSFPQQQQQHALAHRDAGERLSLPDTLRELAVTILGVVGVILVVTTVVSALGV